jgi:anion-transporting  ArsA/GET3 family ATPase
VKSLLDRRLVVVVGKGGVGKSVISGAFGLQAAGQGRRTVVAEMSGAETMSALFDREPVGYSGGLLARNLEAMSVTSDQAVEEYLVRMLRFRLLYEVVFRNRFIEPFMNGVMGLSDLISIGKVMDLEWLREDGSLGPTAAGPHRWDLVVVDAPATGHGLSLLRAPQSVMDITRMGPMYNNSAMIRDLLADRSRTAVVLVTLAEEMPVSETIELARSLREHVDIEIAGLVVNGVPPDPLADPEIAEGWEEVRAWGEQRGGQAAMAVRETERSIRERRRAEGYIARLRDELGLPMAEVPMLARRDLDADALREIGQHLEWTS